MLECTVCLEEFSDIYLLCCKEKICISCIKNHLIINRNSLCPTKGDPHEIITENEELRELRLSILAAPDLINCEILFKHYLKFEKKISEYNDLLNKSFNKIYRSCALKQILQRLKQRIERIPEEVAIDSCYFSNNVIMDLDRNLNRSIIFLICLYDFLNRVCYHEKISRKRFNEIDEIVKLMKEKIFPNDESILDYDFDFTDYNSHGFDIEVVNDRNLLIDEEILEDIDNLIYKVGSEIHKIKFMTNNFAESISRDIPICDNLANEFLYHFSFRQKDRMNYNYIGLSRRIIDLNEKFNTLRGDQKYHTFFYCTATNCHGIIDGKQQPLVCKICFAVHCSTCGSIECKKIHCTEDNNIIKFVKCPACSIAIEKEVGCDHIYCTNCTHRFNYQTLLSMENDITFHNELESTHKRTERLKRIENEMNKIFKNSEFILFSGTDRDRIELSEEEIANKNMINNFITRNDSLNKIYPKFLKSKHQEKVTYIKMLHQFLRDYFFVSMNKHHNRYELDRYQNISLDLLDRDCLLELFEKFQESRDKDKDFWNEVSEKVYKERKKNMIHKFVEITLFRLGYDRVILYYAENVERWKSKIEVSEIRKFLKDLKNEMFICGENIFSTYETKFQLTSDDSNRKDLLESLWNKFILSDKKLEWRDDQNFVMTIPLSAIMI